MISVIPGAADDGVAIDNLTIEAEPVLSECEIELSQAYDLIGQLETDLDDANDEIEVLNVENETLKGNVDEGASGLTEIQNLISTPLGQRESSSSYTGDLGEQLNSIIQMLLSPPGQNISSNTPQGKKKGN